MDLYNKIVKIYTKLEESICTTAPSLNYTEILVNLITLADLINDYPDETESLWCIGESSSASLDSLIVGAYRHLVEWHDGQSSLSYAALSALGSVFSPGCSNGPEDDTSEKLIYELLEDIAGNVKYAR